MSENIIENYNVLIQKYSEFKECCEKFDFSLYFNNNLKEVINWLINNKKENTLDDVDSDDEEFKKLNSKENINCLFNNFYWVFNFEFNAMLYNKKYKGNLNKLSNKERLKLINECIDYFCEFYKEYIQDLFVYDLKNDNQFIFLRNKDKDKYLNIEYMQDRTKCIISILTRIRFKIIKYYYDNLIDYLETIIDPEKITIETIFKYSLSKLFNNDFVKKYSNNMKTVDKYHLYFSSCNTDELNIKEIIYNNIEEEKFYDEWIPKDDLYYLINK